ncbi:hypothetical protein EK904_010201 [Melospiza melodia maxima]|nr:hypothetical protein EK904_010201 [Melospiza melodia maxima]
MGSLVLCGCIVGNAAKDSALAASAEMNANSAGPESSETSVEMKSSEAFASGHRMDKRIPDPLSSQSAGFTEDKNESLDVINTTENKLKLSSWFAGNPHYADVFLHALLTLSLSSSSDFALAFTSKPKIPRTPDGQSSSPRKGKVPAIAPQFSQSGPQQASHPSSSGSARSRQTVLSFMLDLCCVHDRSDQSEKVELE